MHYKTCEICGIRSGRTDDQKRIFIAKFPMNEDRCKQWVKATGNEDLLYIPIEKLHQLKRLCGSHFMSKDFKKKKTQLKINAVPSVGLSAKPLADEVLIGFPLHISKTNQTESTSIISKEYNYCESWTIPTPSTSTAEPMTDGSKKRKFRLETAPSTLTARPMIDGSKKRKICFETEPLIRNAKTAPPTNRKSKPTMTAKEELTPRKKKTTE